MFDYPLDIVLGRKSKDGTAAVPYSSGEGAVNAAYTVALMKAVWVLFHKVDYSSIKTFKNTEKI